MSEQKSKEAAALLAPCVGSLSIEVELAQRMGQSERAERMRKLLVRVDDAWKLLRSE